MLANTIRDTNFTNVALLIFSNNETMNKIRKNVDTDTIVRNIMREVDYEKLISGLWSAAEKEFDLEHFLTNIINQTNLDIIHDEIFKSGSLPGWLVKSIHPNLTVQKVQQIFSTLKNVTHKFVQVLSKSERFDNYLFNMITQQALTPLNNIIQGVKDDKPKTFNQLIEIIVNNANRVAKVSEIDLCIKYDFYYFRNNLEQVQNKQQRKNQSRNHRHQLLHLLI
jgi:hypothetical protein